MLTERHKRCLERAWSQREVKVNKKFMRRRRYLTVRKAELEEAVEGVEGTISRIRDAMFDDLGVLLHVREDTEVNAEPVRKPEELSRAQSTRLRNQALATSEMLRQLRDRWLLQAHHFGEALEAFLAAEAFGVSSKRKYAADKKIAESLNESSLIRLDNSLVLIAERVVKTNKLHYKPSTILGWVRQFRTLGHFKRDGRGVHEREWILSEEDIRLELLQWLSICTKTSWRRCVGKRSSRWDECAALHGAAETTAGPTSSTVRLNRSKRSSRCGRSRRRTATSSTWSRASSTSSNSEAGGRGKFLSWGSGRS